MSQRVYGVGAQIDSIKRGVISRARAPLKSNSYAAQTLTRCTQPFSYDAIGLYDIGKFGFFTTIERFYEILFNFSALGLPGWIGLDKSAAIAIVLALILLTTALGTAYKLYHCKRNRDLRDDEMRTVNTGQYHGEFHIHYLTFVKKIFFGTLISEIAKPLTTIYHILTIFPTNRHILPKKCALILFDFRKLNILINFYDECKHFVIFFSGILFLLGKFHTQLLALRSISKTGKTQVSENHHELETLIDLRKGAYSQWEIGRFTSLFE